MEEVIYETYCDSSLYVTWLLGTVAYSADITEHRMR